jgi:hypothetical protein
MQEIADWLQKLGMSEYAELEPNAIRNAKMHVDDAKRRGVILQDCHSDTTMISALALIAQRISAFGSR